MSEYVEVTRVQPHFMVQLCLDATRLGVWDVCLDLFFVFFVDSALLFQELTNSTYDYSALILLNCWAHIDMGTKRATKQPYTHSRSLSRKRGDPRQHTGLRALTFRVCVTSASIPREVT